MIKDTDKKNINEKLRNKSEKEICSLSSFLSDNPNPVFRINNKYGITYSNAPGDKILEELGLKNKKIPKSFIDLTEALIKRKNDGPMILELNVGSKVFEFSIIKVKNTDYYNIYGNDITDRDKKEKSKQEVEKKEILLDERNYIARELHDTVTQTLFSANLIAEVIPKLWEKDPDGVIKRLNEVRILNNVALTEIRALLFDLRPASFKNENLIILIKELVKSIGVKSKIPITVEVIKKHGYPHNIELGFYRIAQEALNNIIKHSCASRAKLILKSLSSKITLDIDDDGIGFNTNDTFPENLGLIIMKERAKMMGASFNLESNPNRGTKISVVYNNNDKKNNYDGKKYN